MALWTCHLIKLHVSLCRGVLRQLPRAFPTLWWCQQVPFCCRPLGVFPEVSLQQSEHWWRAEKVAVKGNSLSRLSCFFLHWGYSCPVSLSGSLTSRNWELKLFTSLLPYADMMELFPVGWVQNFDSCFYFLHAFSWRRNWDESRDPGPLVNLRVLWVCQS